MTGYEPLNTLKPVAHGLWVIDGEAVITYGFPFSTRATVVQLENGDLWVHSPTLLTRGLREELDALGPVRHLVAPNCIHYLHLRAWSDAFPEATLWTAPGVQDRAAKNGVDVPEGEALQWDRAEAPWSGQINQLIVRGSTWFHEAAFFHVPTRSLILTDLIEAFDTAKLPARCRPFVWLMGIDNTDGKTPPLIRRTFRDKTAMAEDIETLLDWGPRRVIFAHGDWYQSNGTAELERAFHKLLRGRAWEKAVDEIKARENQ